MKKKNFDVLFFVISIYIINVNIIIESGSNNLSTVTIKNAACYLTTKQQTKQNRTTYIHVNIDMFHFIEFQTRFSIWRERERKV
jgi:hypothetical protein